MQGFEYRVSVIVPIYNAEKYLAECLDSLVGQTIGGSEMEVILMNDGSTDRSLDICKEYAEIYPFFTVICTENQGVSAARNRGIQEAKGKYIAFLDGDDTLTPETIASAADFFDTVYDEVDLVTYKIIPYLNGKKQKLHFRYKYLTKTGIYDLRDVPYCVQTTMNIVVKNNKDVLFDTHLAFHEDQKYICTILSEKMKIGYCEVGQYIYNKHMGSATSDKNYSYYMFEKRMDLVEKLMEPYGNDVPPYIQSQIITDFMWELSADKLFPYHYSGNQYKKALQRIYNVIRYIDADIIYNHPEMDSFHKHFWLSKKDNAYAAVILEEKEISIWMKSICIYKKEGVEIVVSKLDIRKNCLCLMGFVKSPVFNYIESEPAIYAVINEEERQLMEHYESINSCYKTKAKTSRFFGFRFEEQIDRIKDLSFSVNIEGVEVNAFMYFMPSVGAGLPQFVKSGYEFQAMRDKILVAEWKEAGNTYDRTINGKKYIFEVDKIRNLASEKRKNEKVWLYCDSAGIKADNAYYQFQHDWNKKDGVKRYYICDGNHKAVKELFTEEQQSCLIAYGSNNHKILYLCAEYVLCSFIDFRPRCPFGSETELSYFLDLEQPQIIYLQHGVCHADLRYMQSAERCKTDKIVVSSPFEYECFRDKYHYKPEELITCGMARYDMIHRHAKAKNRILFAPSWREYLTHIETGNIRSDNRMLIYESNYYRKFIDFLRCGELKEFLQLHDLYLDVKLHQNMRSAIEIFDIPSERIRFKDENINVADYKIFITDISSYVFDFAYLNRPVIYFMPDMEEFLSGMHSYRKLELPFEQAFGKLVDEYQDAVKEMKRIADHGFQADPVYRERMENFYFPLKNCRENLYEYLRSCNSSDL